MDFGDRTPTDFDAAIAAALERLPDEFRASLENVAIVVDDYPTTGQLHATNAPGLFGIYEGVPRTAYGASNAPIANKITLFRRPLEMFNPHPDELVTAIESTLFHEIGHHMGLSDERLRQLEAERRRRQRTRAAD